MKPKALIKELCKREGLKKQMDIAQVTELVGHIADIFYETFGYDKIQLHHTLYSLGLKRAKKKKKKA